MNFKFQSLYKKYKAVPHVIIIPEHENPWFAITTTTLPAFMFCLHNNLFIKCIKLVDQI
jgi:hypothetical protein